MNNNSSGTTVIGDVVVAGVTRQGKQIYNKAVMIASAVMIPAYGSDECRRQSYEKL
jgi:hypothetical protein